MDEFHFSLLRTIRFVAYHIPNLFSRGSLDVVIRQVNDIGKHEDIPWDVRFQPSGDPLPATFDKGGLLNFIEYEKLHAFDREDRGRQIKMLMKKGKLGLRHTREHIMAKSRYEEGLENYVYAFTVIGASTNTTLEVDLNSHRLSPMVIFDMNDRFVPFVIKTEITSKIITCSEKLKFSYRLTDMQVFRDLVTIFEWRIWLGIGISYPGVGLLFGLLYCGLARCNHRKKKVFKKYLRAPPFRVGTWALINQVENRSVNGKPFGFMGWIVVPWLLIAVILNFAFRSENLLNFGRSRVIMWNIWRLTPSVLQSHNISVFTDDRDVSKDYVILPFPVQGNYEKIANHLAMDKSVALISASDRVDTLMSCMKCHARSGDIMLQGRWGGWPRRRKHTVG